MLRESERRAGGRDDERKRGERHVDVGEMK